MVSPNAITALLEIFKIADKIQKADSGNLRHDSIIAGIHAEEIKIEINRFFENCPSESKPAIFEKYSGKPASGDYKPCPNCGKKMGYNPDTKTYRHPMLN